MIYSIRSGFQRLAGRLRTRFGERATAFVLALLLEALIVLALLTFGPSPFEARKAPDNSLFTIDVPAAEEPSPEPEVEEAEPEAEPEPVPDRPPPEPQPPEPQPPEPPAPQKPAFIEVKPDRMAAIDLRAEAMEQGRWISPTLAQAVTARLAKGEQ
ncbi:MAG: hypothetical protein KKF13_13185, partial [Alphaproteobacteria bacterium]|nr:hypothetical protein [Alphaproteobacteria bacterium]